MRDEFEKYQAIDTSNFVSENEPHEHTFHSSKSNRTFREVVNDEFYIRYNSDIADAQIDFEDQIYSTFQLKLIDNTLNTLSELNGGATHVKRVEKSDSLSLSQIIKKHSTHYEKIREEVHQKRLKYYS